MRFIIIIVFFLITDLAAQQDLPEIGTGLAEVNYYQDYFPFTDAIKNIRWINVATWNNNGFPASANTGDVVIGRNGISSEGKLPNGEYVLTWEGNGDVIFYNSIFTLISEDLSGLVKRRVYQVTTQDEGVGVQINSYPVTNIKLWIPGRANHPSVWNPAYLCYISGFENSVLRTMDLGQTNNSEQRTWTSRTPKNWSTYVNRNNQSAPYEVKGGVAYEVMMELANEMNSDLWICIPHLADSIYVYNLAHLIKTGIDLNTSEQTTEPLNDQLKVWIEYSNEVWNYTFAQSHYALDSLPGNNLNEKYALQAVKLYDIFMSSFNDSTRVVRALGTQTTSPSRTIQRIDAVDTTDFDVLAITTYFRFDYHEFIYENWNAGSLSHEDFYDHISLQIDTGAFDVGGDPAYLGPAVAYAATADINKHVVSYEGNEHFNMNRRVDTDNNGVPDTELAIAIPATLDWMYEFCRSNYMYDLLQQFQDRHELSGLQTHVPFVAVREWSFYGQWGYAEYLNQPMNEATKYRWLHDYYNLDYPTVCDSLSNEIDIQLKDESIILMPNPTSDVFEIFGITSGYSIDVLDINGMLFQNYNSIGNSISIDLSSLPPGMFFIAIENSNNQMVRLEKIIKQ